MERQYVAIDLHRRRSVIVRENEAGEEVGVVCIDNDPVALSMALADAGPDAEVAIERRLSTSTWLIPRLWSASLPGRAWMGPRRSDGTKASGGIIYS